MLAEVLSLCNSLSGQVSELCQQPYPRTRSDGASHETVRISCPPLKARSARSSTGERNHRNGVSTRCIEVSSTPLTVLANLLHHHPGRKPGGFGCCFFWSAERFPLRTTTTTTARGDGTAGVPKARPGLAMSRRAGIRSFVKRVSPVCVGRVHRVAPAAGAVPSRACLSRRCKALTALSRLACCGGGFTAVGERQACQVFQRTVQQPSPISIAPRPRTAGG